MSLTGYNPSNTISFGSGIYHHVALTISGNTHTVYLDGSAVATNSSAGNVFNSYNAIQQLYIGCAADLSYGFTGLIDDFKVFNRALPYNDIIKIYSEVLTLDKLSVSAKSVMLGTSPQQKQSGALGVRLLYTKYTGPVMKIKVGTYSGSTFNGSQEMDFYAPQDGTTGINVLKDINGNTLASYITTWGGTCYVTVWYDQTGNSNNGNWVGTGGEPKAPPYSYFAGQTVTPTYPPTFNTITNVIDFTNNGYFKLPDSSFPVGNTAYSYIFKPTISSFSAKNCIYRGGNWNGDSGSSSQGIIYTNKKYGNNRINNDSTSTVNFTNDGQVIADTDIGGTLGNTGRYFYFDGVLNTPTHGGNTNSRIQTSGSNYVGGPYGSGEGGSSYPNFKGTLPYFIWANASLSVTDIKSLGNTPV